MKRTFLSLLVLALITPMVLAVAVGPAQADSNQTLYQAGKKQPAPAPTPKPRRPGPRDEGEGD